MNNFRLLLPASWRSFTLPVLLPITLGGCLDLVTTQENRSVIDSPATLEQLQQLYPEREYISLNNYITYENSEDVQLSNRPDLDVQIERFPKYHISVAQEWPKEDLNDEQSYDMPRFQFALGNVRGPDAPDAERGLKLWSIKTDGTDLRLITDQVNATDIDVIIRSPNNRLVAWTGNSGSKYVFDLKTGERTTVSPNGAPSIAFSEDSRYLYFRRFGRELTQRWDSETGEITDVEGVTIGYIGASQSVSYGGKRFTVVDYGVLTSDEQSHERLSLLRYDLSVPSHHRKLELRAISPTGRYAWGRNNSYAYLFDTKEQTVARMDGDYIYLHVLGKDARYSASGSSANRIIDHKLNKVWQVGRFGVSHSCMSCKPSLYNGLANDGLWFKEAQ